jgi:hypothetical protein
VGQPQLVAQARPDFGLEHTQVAQLQLVALENLQLAHCPLSQAILCVVHMLTYNVIYINIKNMEKQTKYARFTLPQC